MLSIKNMRSSKGFTLIEMAIVIMILGVAIAAFSPLYKLYLEDRAIQTTQRNVDSITAAIGSFRGINGRYPCPASLISNRNDPAYGREDCRDYSGTLNPGNCDLGVGGSGLCREQSERAIDYMNPYTAGNPIIPAGNPPVRIGAIPFRELNLEEPQAYDGYENHIMYAVTEHLTNDTTFRADEGGIEIVNNDPTPASVLNPPASAHFLIYSSGKNANGAFPKGGVQFNCPVNGPEQNNCDVNVNSRYSLTQISNAGGTSEFDDVLAYFTQSEIPLWQFSNRQQGAIVQKPGGDVGMAFPSPGQSFTSTASNTSKNGQISDTLRAQPDPVVANTGKVMASELCASGGPAAAGNCFSTQLIAGTGMRCPTDDHIGATGAYMVGISGGAPDCRDNAPIQCPSGQVMNGINPDGSIRCVSNAICPSSPVDLCGTTFTLASGPQGTNRTINAGLTMTQRYRCDANGTWSLRNSAGVCTCTPQNDQTNPNVSCGTGFSGTFTQTRSYICPTAGSPPGTMPYWTPWAPPGNNGGNTWTYPGGIGCNCVGANDVRSVSCPSGYTPTPNISQQTRQFVCDPTGLGGTWSNWTPTYTCNCTGYPDQTEWIPCGGNSPPGSLQEITWHFTCPDIWDYTVTDASQCTCSAWSQTRTNDPCPVPGSTGFVTNRYDYQCPSGVTVTELSNTCQPPPPIVCSWTSNNLRGASSSMSAPGPKLGTSGTPACTCGDTVPQCHTGTPGNFQIYEACVCGGGN